MTRYRLGTILGAGGMATVHEGWRRLADGSDQPVAIKRIKPELGNGQDLRERFHREARVCIALAHPALVKVYDFDRNQDPRFIGEGELFIVMERINGLSLAQLAKQSRIPHALLRSILVQALGGLAYLHQHDIVHRDISPTNILVSQTGAVKIVDFGLATILRAPATEGGFAGNPPYACPEQLEGRPLDPCADLYALAALAYELLAGAPPFGRGGPTLIGSRQSAAARWTVPPLPDDVPEDLRCFVDGLLQPWQQRRFRSAEEAARALHAHQQPVGSNDELAALVRRNMQEIPSTELPRWRDAPAPRARRPGVLRRSVPAMLALGLLAAGCILYDAWPRTDSPTAGAADPPGPPGPPGKTREATAIEAGGHCTAAPAVEPWNEPAAAGPASPATPLPTTRSSDPRAARRERLEAPPWRTLPIVEHTSLSRYPSSKDL